MQRTISQFRPKGDGSALPYSPQRDLANIYTPMLREVFCGLDEKNWTPYFREWFERENITESDLADAVFAFTEAHRLFIRDREVNTPADAFTKAGMGKFNQAIQQALFARIGETLMGGFFIALRDVTTQGQETPGQTEFTEMLAAGRELSERLSGKFANYHIADGGRLSEVIRENFRIVDQLRDQVDNALRAESLAREQLAAYQQHLFQPVAQAGWFKRIFVVLGIAWKLYWKKS